MDPFETEIAVLVAVAQAEDSADLKAKKAIRERVVGALHGADGVDTCRVDVSDLHGLLAAMSDQIDEFERKRDTQAIWNAASAVADADPRYVLITLAIDGFNQRWWLDKHTRLTARERRALEAYRSDASDKRRLSEISRAMGWSRPDRKRGAAVRPDSVALHFSQVPG